jgi:hypothetical protein
MKFFLALSLCIAMPFALFAQDIKWPELDKSPTDMATYPREAAFANYLEADDPNRSPKIKVNYSRPSKNGRVIFGDLVPYGKDWRLGANEGTEVLFYQNVEIGGVVIPRGRYRLYAEVNENSWDIVVSSYIRTSGSSNLDKDKELGRFKAKTTKTGSVRELFTIGFQKIDEGHVNMLFEWDQVRATLPINLNASELAGPDASPMDIASYPRWSQGQNFHETPEALAANAPKIKIVYSRPQKKGRNIFGELLPYGEVWRLGANETTTFTLYEDAKVGDLELKKGTYGLFAIVNKDNWEIIVHKDTNSWGAANHDDETNVGKVIVPVATNKQTLEAFTVFYEKVDDKKVNVLFGWDTSMVKMPVTFK